MRLTGIRVVFAGVAAVTIGIYAERGLSNDKKLSKDDPVSVAVEKG